VHALGRFRTPKAAEVLRPLALGDASYLVEAEASRSLGGTRQASAFETLLDTLDRPSWADVVRAGTLDGLAELRDDRAVPHVLARTRYGVSTRGRRAAILALPKLSSDRRARETLEDMLADSDPYLRVDVVRALGDLADPKSRGALQRQLDRELDGRVRRRIRETLRDLGGTPRREAERLRDELEAIRGEHADLKARLAKIEGLVGADKDDKGAAAKSVSSAGKVAKKASKKAAKPARKGTRNARARR
jgi:aminopeptidase N